MFKLLFTRSGKCKCEEPPFYYLKFHSKELGEDATHGEVSLEKCKKCGTYWLKYLIEQPQYTKAGRWWRVRISQNDLENFTVEMAKSYIENQDWCFVGGSFYDQGIHKKERPITVV